MNLPNIVTEADLKRLAAPDETLAVRLVIRQINNTGPYTLRGAAHRYIAIRDNEVGAHIVDVPLSIWMYGVPKGVYAKNPSVAQDVQSTRNALKSPLIILVVPWKHAKKSALDADKANPLATFTELAKRTGAPPFIMDALALLGSDRAPADIDADLLRLIRESSEESTPDQGGPEPAAEQAAAPAKKAAKKAAAKKAAKSATPAAPAKKEPKSNAQRQKEYRDRKKQEQASA